MPFGIGFIFLLMLVGGVAAYWGDRVGMTVGRRRLTFMGLRPKYTSRVIAVGTGVLIVLFTLATMLVVSNNVRIALFGIEELQEKVIQLSAEVATFEQRRTELEARNEELRRLNEQLERETAQLEAEKVTLAQEIEFLEMEIAATRKELEAVYVLGEQFYYVAQDLYGADFLVRRDEVLGTILVDVTGSREEVLENLRKGIAEVEERLLDRGLGAKDRRDALRLDRIYQTEDGQLIAFTEQEVLAEAVQPLLQAAEQGYQSVIVQLSAMTNARVGDPVLADFTRFVPNRVVLRPGDVVSERIFDPSLPKPVLFEEFLHFVGVEVAEVARSLLLPPNGEYGEVSSAEAYETVDRIARHDGPVRVRAVAAREIWAYGSLDVRFEFEPA